MRAARTAICLALLAVLAGCPSSADDVPAGQFRIATGSPGGVYFLYGGAIADSVRKRLPDLTPSVMETAASAENLRLVEEGKAEIGFAQADTSAEFAGDGRVVALVRLYDDYLHLVVRTDSGITSLTGLRGKRVSIGAKESGTIGTTRRLLGTEQIDPAKDIQPFELGLDDSAAALQANRIDAFFFSGGLPVGRVAELAERGGITMVSIGQYAADLRARFGQYYTEHTVPASTYGLQTVTTVGIPNYLVVSKDLPEQTAYEVTRLLFEDQATLLRAHPVAARLNSRSAIYTHPLALHPGARRYFRQIKP
ncbi:TAXI family TRAP transporter solute-binding subunit [Virgisporangium ochraceum]|uniref:C4-dicarboxylate ABC transporter substrate-binding protein n=1 Tax=Virgisporangium ochraceum TaxID=65505 RepID=A0A8J4EC13_9ACTN|nr:C4-dicarboxylate ABC transporter substrate-binding protein [Virgisporangium ochraceum]